MLEKKYENKRVLITGNRIIKIQNLIKKIQKILKIKKKVFFKRKPMMGHYDTNPFNDKPKKQIIYGQTFNKFISRNYKYYKQFKKMIAIIQSSEELSILKKKYSKVPIIFALNLDVATYCRLNNIKFIFPFEKKNYNDITKEILLASKNFIETIDFSNIKYSFLINEIKAILRYKFNQIVFLIESVSQINSEYKKIIYTDYFQMQSCGIRKTL